MPQELAYPAATDHPGAKAAHRLHLVWVAQRGEGLVIIEVTAAWDLQLVRRRVGTASARAPACPTEQRREHVPFGEGPPLTGAV
jgi:hypothetical protein